MKILIVNTWYYPNLMGGAEHSVKILAENLAKNGNNVAVFCVDGKNETIKKELINNVLVYRSNGGKYNLYEAYYSKRNLIKKFYDKYKELINSSIIPILDSVINEFSPDIIHCNCFSGISFLLFNYCKKKAIPVVLTVRNYTLLYPADGQKISNALINNILTCIYRVYGKYITNCVGAVTAPSNFTLNEHMKIGFFKNAYIKRCVPNCVELDTNVVQDMIIQRRGRQRDVINFLYAGWITEEKGIRHMLDAFESLNNDNNRYKLSLCGDGYLVDMLRERTASNPNIIYKGKLSSDSLSEEYKNADILIVPSIWDEPFGRVLIEASAYGLPIICSNRGGMPEIINVIQNGIIYQGGNITELRDAMTRMTDKAYRDSYSSKILSGISYYSETNQIKMFCEIYNSIVEMNNGRNI